MAFISLQNLAKTYRSSQEAVLAVREINVEIEAGEFLAIMGPSGSGKSTLLTVLGAMSMPTSGKVIIDGVDVYSLSPDGQADFRKKYIGFLFQHLHLVPYLTALENVMLPLVITKTDRPKAEIALEVLSRVGLEGKAHRLPDQLSGGEQSRVAIARAVVNTPPIILGDEPTGNLDSKTGTEILDLLKELNQQGHTVIIVTHNKDAAAFSQRVLSIYDGKVISS